MTAPPTPVPAPLPSTIPAPLTATPSAGHLVDQVVTVATYPWVAAIVTALAAFLGALLAQYIQGRRERITWERTQERDRTIRAEERERDRIAWRREDQQRFASDSRTAFQKYLTAAHELEFTLKRVDPESDLDMNAHIQVAGDSLTNLVKVRAELELFANNEIFTQSGEINLLCLGAYRSVVFESSRDEALTALRAASDKRKELALAMRRSLYAEISLPVEVDL